MVLLPQKALFPLMAVIAIGCGLWKEKPKVDALACKIWPNPLVNPFLLQ
jgi:hypothetical protein